MASFNININQLRTLITDFDKCVQTLKSSFNSFFDDISKFDGWNSEVSKQYLDSITLESEEYLRFTDTLNSFVSILSDACDDLESALVTSGKDS